MFKLEIEYNQGALIARLKGILNRKNSYKINNYLNPLIKKHNIKYLIYDFKDLEIIEGSGIDAILNSKYCIKENKGKFWVCNVGKKLMPIIKNYRFKRLIDESEVFKLMEMK